MIIHTGQQYREQYLHNGTWKCYAWTVEWTYPHDNDKTRLRDNNSRITVDVFTRHLRRDIEDGRYTLLPAPKPSDWRSQLTAIQSIILDLAKLTYPSGFTPADLADQTELTPDEVQVQINDINAMAYANRAQNPLNLIAPGRFIYNSHDYP